VEALVIRPAINIGVWFPRKSDVTASLVPNHVCTYAVCIHGVGKQAFAAHADECETSNEQANFPKNTSWKYRTGAGRGNTRPRSGSAMRIHTAAHRRRCVNREQYGAVLTCTTLQ